MTSRLNYTGEPKPKVRIEPVGDHSLPTVNVERSGIETPEPRAFELVNTAQVKLAVAGNHVEDGEIDEALNALIGDIGELVRLMCERRGLDEDATRDVLMGNIEALPECSKE